MSLHLKFDQTPELTYDFSKTVLLQNRRLKIVLIIGLLLMALAIVFSLLSNSFTLSELLSGIIPFVIIVGIWFLLIPILMKWQIKRSIAQNKLGMAREMQISDEEILLKTKASDSTIKWDGISKTGESSLSYFLYIANNQALVVPKSCLTDDMETEFLALLHRKGL